MNLLGVTRATHNVAGDAAHFGRIREMTEKPVLDREPLFLEPDQPKLIRRTASELAGVVARGLTGIGLAVAGAGAWSLVAGYLALAR